MLHGSYDPKNNTVVVQGQLIDGFADDTMIKVSRNEEGWSFQPSNSGGGARSRNPNKSGRAEITLKASSPANAVLSAIAIADELRGEGIGEFLVKDRSSTAASCSGQNCWIVKHPDWERQKEVGNVTWIIEIEEVDIFHSGLIPPT